MDTIINMLEFFLNNIFKISVIIVATVVFLYLIRKVYRETRLNQFLRLRQRTLRRFKISKRKMRIIGLSFLITLPLPFLAWFLIITRLPGFNFDDHISHIDNVEHLVEIHQRYHPSYTAINFGQAPSDIDGDLRELNINDTFLFRHNPTEFSIDTMYVVDNRVYTLFEDKLLITNIEDIENPYEEDSISFDDDFYPLGFYVEEDTYIIIGKTKNNYQCLPYRVSCFNYNNEENIRITIFEKSNLSKTHEIEIPGYLVDIRMIESSLVMVVNQQLPYDDEGNLDSLQLVSSLPYIKIDDTIYNQIFRDIKYIEGTRPNAFTSVIQLKLDNMEHLHHTLLTDIEYNLKINDKGLYFFNNSYVLKDMADHFITPDPIAYTNTAITKYSFNESVLEYERTKIIEGEIFSHTSVEIFNNQLTIATIDKEGDLIISLYNTSLDLRAEIRNPINDTVRLLQIQKGNVYIRVEESTPPYFVAQFDDFGQHSITQINFRNYVLDYYLIRENQFIGLSISSGLFTMNVYRGLSIDPDEDLYWYIRNVASEHMNQEIRLDYKNIRYDELTRNIIIPAYSLDLDMLIFATITENQGFREVFLVYNNSNHVYFRMQAMTIGDHYVVRDGLSLKIYHKDNMEIPIYTNE